MRERYRNKDRKSDKERQRQKKKERWMEWMNQSINQSITWTTKQKKRTNKRMTTEVPQCRLQSSGCRWLPSFLRNLHRRENLTFQRPLLPKISEQGAWILNRHVMFVVPTNFGLLNSADQDPSWEAQSLSWSRNFRTFMEPEVSLQCSQEPATSPYSEPYETSPHFTSYVF
jgi:hypothetical protein